MNQEEKLKAVIEKAIEGGWTTFGGRSIKQILTDSICPVDGVDMFEVIYVLFDHDFARPFFGEERIKIFTSEIPVDKLTDKYQLCQMEIIASREQPAWQYHLQQAVLSQDPLTYYYDNI